MQPLEPILSVLVCTYNRADLLPGCLASLAGQTLGKEFYEVIVVDNNSGDGTRQVAEKFLRSETNFSLVTEPKQGLSHARNRGCREARGAYVAYLDDDAKATPEWCERILAAFQGVVPPPVAVGGEIHPFYESAPPPWFTADFELRTWGSCAGFLEPPRARYGFSGSNMSFRKTVLEESGGFSAEYGMTGRRTRMGEDAELFCRLYRKYPFFWYDPAIRVFHWTPKRNMTLSYRFHRNYRAGESTASMQNRVIFSRAYLCYFLDTLSFVARMRFSLIKNSDSAKRENVRKMEELAVRLGYLFGRLY